MPLLEYMNGAHRIYTLSIIFLFICIFNCKQTKFQNPCDPASESFLLRLLFQYFTKDSTPQCGISVFPRISNVESPYPGKNRWLDYIKNDGIDILSASNTECDGQETGGYSNCLHVGEIRRVKLYGGVFFGDPCDQLRAEDSENTFNFACITDKNGTSLTTTSIKEGKRLGNLIDHSSNPPRFKPLKVFVFQDNVLVGTTEESVWWTNKISNLPIAGGSLNEQYTIYSAPNSTNISSQILISANKVSIVSKSDIEINVAGGILVNGKFSYLEGAFFGSPATELLTVNSSASFFFFRDSILNLSSNFTIFDLSASNARIQGIYLQGSTSASTAFRTVASTKSINNNFISDIVIGNSDSYRVYIEASNSSNKQTNHFYSNFLIHGGTDEPLFISQTTNGLLEGNSFRELTIVNSSGTGHAISLQNTNTIQNHSVQNFLSFNGGGIDLSLSSGAQTNASIFFNNLAFDNSTSNPISISLIAGTSFLGKLILRDLSTCSTTGLNPGISNATCLPQNSSNFVLSRFPSLSTSFVGSVFQDDTKNSADLNGFVSPVPTNNPLAVGRFENTYRDWGVNNGGVFNASNRSACGGACRIEDWSLKATDNYLRNVNSCPNGNETITQIFYGSGSSDADCSNFMRGAKATSDNKCQSVHLKNARELMFDGKGNDNGYCESNEDCLYTPNIGAYQGHGKIVRAMLGKPKICSDIEQGGIIEKVRVFQYEFNGY